jgi:hypothetical protein
MKIAAVFFQSAVRYRRSNIFFLTCRAFSRLDPIEMPHLQRTGALIGIKKLSSDQRDRHWSAKSFRHSSIDDGALKGSWDNVEEKLFACRRSDWLRRQLVCKHV